MHFLGIVSVETVFLRSEMEFLFEYPVEVRKVGYANADSDLCYPHSSSKKKVRGDIKPVIVYVFNACHTHIFLKETHEIMLAEIDGFRKLVYGYRIHVILADIVEYHFYALCCACLYGIRIVLTFKEISEEEIEHTEKLCFELQLKAFLFIVINTHY